MTKVTEVQKRYVAFEVLLMEHTGKTKKEIAEECEVKPQFVDRYANKYKLDALKTIQSAAAASLDKNVIQLLNRLPAEPDEKEQPRHGRGRQERGRKTIRDIVLEVMNAYYDAEEFTKDNREAMILEIMQKTGHDHETASKYFSGYKKQVGEYQDEVTTH